MPEWHLVSINQWTQDPQWECRAVWSSLHCSAMHPPLPYNPGAKANLKHEDMAPWGGATHTQTHSHTHAAQRYSLCMSDCAPVCLDFYVSWFKSPLHLGCSVSSMGFSRSWQSVTPMFTGISSVLFLLCSVFTLSFFFLSCHFLVLCLDLSLKRRRWKEKKSKKGKKMESTGGCVSQSWTSYWQRSLLWQSNSVSLDTLFFIFLVVLMKALRHWQVWQVSKAAPRPSQRGCWA